MNHKILRFFMRMPTQVRNAKNETRGAKREKCDAKYPTLLFLFFTFHNRFCVFCDKCIAGLTSLYVWMMKTSPPSTNRANCQTWGWSILYQFSCQHKVIWSDIWTTTSTVSSIRRIWWNLCSFDDDYCSRNHFEFKDSPECSQFIQTREHSCCASAHSCIRTFICRYHTASHIRTLHSSALQAACLALWISIYGVCLDYLFGCLVILSKGPIGNFFYQWGF